MNGYGEDKKLFDSTQVSECTIYFFVCNITRFWKNITYKVLSKKLSFRVFIFEDECIYSRLVM